MIFFIIYFTFYHVYSPPSNNRQPDTYRITFDTSESFTWTEFNNYIIDTQGHSLSYQSSPMKNYRDNYTNLINTIDGDNILFELAEGVHIEVDLNQKGRFMVINNSTVELRGTENSSLTIKNGRGVWDGNIDAYSNNWSNAAGIRQNGGSFDIIGCDIHVIDSEAGGAVGMYLFEGTCDLYDNGPTPSRMYFSNNNAFESACGGLSIWNTHLTIHSDEGLIMAENCSTIHHCGGFVLFKGILELEGENALIYTLRCQAGGKNPNHSYAGGIQIGDFCSNDGNPRVLFTGTNSTMIAEQCSAWSASGIRFRCGTIDANPDHPVFQAIDNIIVDHKSNPDKTCYCAVKISENVRTQDDKPLYIISEGNTCETSGPCYPIVNDSNIELV
jgi:hypothetical protein